jgi:hypothetical protein
MKIGLVMMMSEAFDNTRRLRTSLLAYSSTDQPWHTISWEAVVKQNNDGKVFQLAKTFQP